MARALLLLMLVPTAIGCTNSTGGGSAAPVAGQTQLRDWQKKFGLPIAIGPEELPFTVDATRETFLRANRAANKLADAGWASRPGETYRYVGWNSGTGGYRQTYTATWKSVGDVGTGPDSKRPVHSVVLSTELYHKPRQTYGFILHAKRESDDGWVASVNFSRNDGPVNAFDRLQLELSHPELMTHSSSGKTTSSIVLGAGTAQFSATRHDDQFNYQVAISSKPFDAEKRLSQVDAIQQYWTSPDSFRQAALEELARLEGNVRQQIASGDAFSVTTKGGPTGADVPMPVANDRVPETIKRDVLAESLAEIETLRKLIGANYEAMHAAAVAAFPDLPAVVQPSQQK